MARDITLTGGGPWGFTLSGGKDFGAPLKVSKITAGGKAARGGLRFNDYILEINGDSTDNLLHSDAMMLIKTTGVTLSLKLSHEAPQVQPRFSGGLEDTDQPTAERPRPPPPPANAVVPPPQPPVQSSSVSIKTIPKKPVTPDPVEHQASGIVPGSGLESGGTSTQQSPAFKRITIDQPTPSVFSRPAGGSPPTQQFQHMTVEDTNVRKSTQRPQPPSNTPTKVTMTTVKVAKDSPIPKPPPPATATMHVGGGQQQPTSPGGSKVVDRQGVCAACKEPIRGPFASAMGRVWHPDHFACSSCHKTLQDTTFVFEDEKIFCEPCYQRNFSQTCHQCKKPILGPSISAVGLNWHKEHFCCSRCSADLSRGEGFNMENNLLFCADCFGAIYGATCFGCGQKIGGGELWVEALEHQWHSNCFRCEACKNPLEGSTFFAKVGRPYCKSCA